jgi:hypothetical protein
MPAFVVDCLWFDLTQPSPKGEGFRAQVNKSFPFYSYSLSKNLNVTFAIFISYYLFSFLIFAA